MISRRLLWTIALGVIGIVIVSWWMETLPGRVTIINQSGAAITEVSVVSGDQRAEIGTMRNAEARTVTLGAGSDVELRYRGSRVFRWRSPRPLAAGRPVVLYITPGDRIDARDRIGTFSR